MKKLNTNQRPAVFIDRDGILNAMVYDDTHGIMDSPRREDQLHAAKGAGRFTRILRNKGFLAIVVTNQPGLAKGTLTLRDLQKVNKRLESCLKREGGGWDALYYCPHHPKVTAISNVRFVRKCNCRKPKPGMLLNAAKEMSIGLKDSWMVGDGIVDMQAGKAAGCRTILVTKVKLDLLEKFFQLQQELPDFIAADLNAALRIILSKS